MGGGMAGMLGMMGGKGPGKGFDGKGFDGKGPDWDKGWKGGKKGDFKGKDGKGKGGPRYDPETEAMISDWRRAKKNRDYATSDAIREKLRQRGIQPDRLGDDVGSKRPRDDYRPPVNTGPPPAPPETGTPAHDAAVARVKVAQKTNREWQPKWRDYCDRRGLTGKHDPKVYPIAWLEGALRDLGDPGGWLCPGCGFANRENHETCGGPNGQLGCGKDRNNAGGSGGGGAAPPPLGVGTELVDAEADYPPAKRAREDDTAAGGGNDASTLAALLMAMQQQQGGGGGASGATSAD